MVEVSKREKEAGIIPDPDIDTYMEVPAASSVSFPSTFVKSSELL
jgi:hypothetical protein